MSSNLKDKIPEATSGIPYTLKLGRSASTSRANLTTGTYCPSFDQVKNLLSMRPISRPARTRPIH